MDQENSSASSFEDLTHLNENEIQEAKQQGLITEGGAINEDKPKTTSGDQSFMDILGNGQLTKQVRDTKDTHPMHTYQYKPFPQILVEGQDEIRPMHLDWCKVSYVGKLDDGTVVEEATDKELHLGDNEVVQGLDMAIALMNLGEKAVVKADARFAYGAMGLTNEADNNTVVVPPDSTVCTRIRE